MKHTNIQILILRLVAGLLFLHMGIQKYNEGWFSSSVHLQTALAGYEQQATGYHKLYMDSVALPHAGVWSRTIPAGEFLLGSSLVLGCLVPVSTVAGIFMLINFCAANGSLYSFAFFETPWSALILATLLILLLARAGRWAGIDSLLAKKKSKSIFW